jgi:peptidyl-prolyl cis-trans isomerase D
MDNRKLGYRIFLGAAVLVLGGSMLLYLVPQGPASGSADSSDAVAQVGDQSVTVTDIREQLSQIEQRNQVPKPLESLYARRILEQLLFQKEIEYEARQLGVTVSNEEVADRIRQFLPTAFNGGTPIAMDQYAAQVQQRFQMTVPVFEGLIRQGLLEEKFRKLVTDGVSAGPSEIQDEFRIKNEKVKLDYVVIKPEDLESKVTPDESEIKAAYEKNKASYKIPERRIVRYGLVDVNQIRQSIQVSDDQLKQQYQQNIQSYQVPNRVHVQHILFFTQNKPDAEVEEIKKKAEDVLAQVKKGAKFDELAKKYSEDPGTKDKGGDLSWITQGQTVPRVRKDRLQLGQGPGLRTG